MTLSFASPNSTPIGALKRPWRSWTPAEQAAHLADFGASRFSVTAFCRRLGTRRATLARWQQRAAADPTPYSVEHRLARRPGAGASRR